MRDTKTLKTACDRVLTDPSLLPKTIKGELVTYCNAGAVHIARSMGCDDLTGKLADQQYAAMFRNDSRKWIKVPGSAASLWAQDGGLSFAAMTHIQIGEDHGHIAAVYPAPMQYSPSLGKNVPMVANIGKNNKLEKASEAFPVAKGEPDYFNWLG